MVGETGAGFVIFEILRALIALGVLALIVVLCVWAARRISRGPRWLVHRLDPAELLLLRRYAAGEIGRDEYLARMMDLRGGGEPSPEPPSPA